MGVLVEYLTEKCIACNAYVADPKEMCVERDPRIRNIEGDYVRLGGYSGWGSRLARSRLLVVVRVADFHGCNVLGCETYRHRRRRSPPFPPYR